MRLQQILLVGIVLIVALVPARLAAQSDELLSTRKLFRNLYDAGSYAEAEPVALEAMALTESEFGGEHAEAAIALNDLAILYWTLNRWDEAEERFRAARLILEAAPAHYQVMAMGVFNNMTVLLDERGDWQEVEQSYLHTLELIEAEFGRNSALFGRAYSNLGQGCQCSGFRNKKFQITKHKYQTNHNDLNSKSQTIGF